MAMYCVTGRMREEQCKQLISRNTWTPMRGKGKKRGLNAQIDHLIIEISDVNYTHDLASYKMMISGLKSRVKEALW